MPEATGSGGTGVVNHEGTVVSLDAPAEAEAAGRPAEAPAAEARAFPWDLAVGLTAGLLALVVYAVSGDTTAMRVLFVASFGSLAITFASMRAPARRRVPWPDVLLALVVMAVVSPLYVVAVHTAPVQVGSDELAIMSAAKSVAHAHHVDPFGLSTYFGNPNLVFYVFGKLGGLMGGISLYHMRLLHGLFGVAEVGIGFALFRQLLSRWWSAFAALVLGTSHALVMISRLAMRDNTPVLLELGAFALLVRGLRREDHLETFLGGVVAGLGFYTYFPSRIVIFLWLGFLAALAVWYRGVFSLRKLAAFGGIAIAGCVLVAGPVMIATAQAPPSAQQLSKVALLIYPEGRELQRQWVSAPTIAAGVEKNILYGLTAFNTTHEDKGWIYINPHHGFVDPLTGVLIWVGAAAVVVGLRRRRDDPWPLLMLGGFVLLWLLFAFVVNKAPNYTRLLITLPLVAYLVTEAVRTIVGAIHGYVASRGRASASAAALWLGAATLALLVVWNMAIARDYLQLGRRTGDDIGGTVRYVEAHRSIPGERFYLAADQRHPYFVWSGPDMGMGRLDFLAPGQVPPAIAPSALTAFSAPGPFTLFASRDVWSPAASSVARRYPRGQLVDITPDGRLVAFQVPAGSS